jgi:hypothetical protein
MVYFKRSQHSPRKEQAMIDLLSVLCNAVASWLWIVDEDTDE